MGPTFSALSVLHSFEGPKIPYDSKSATFNTIIPTSPLSTFACPKLGDIPLHIRNTFVHQGQRGVACWHWPGQFASLPAPAAPGRGLPSDGLADPGA